MKTLEQLKALSDAELAAEVARVVMGGKVDHVLWSPLVSPFAWQEVEDALDRRGLGPRYVEILRCVVLDFPKEHPRHEMWRLLRAPLRQRCEAAILAAGEAGEE